MKVSRIAWSVVRTGVGIALLVWLSRSGLLDWRQIAALRAEPGALLLALGLMAGGLAATAWRLCVLATPLNFSIRFGASLRLLLIGTCFNVLMPGAAGGDIARLYLTLRDQQGRRTELAAILIFDRVVGLVALLFVPLMAALVFPGVARLYPTIVTILTWAAGLAVLAGLVALGLWGPIGRAWVTRHLPWLPLDGIVARAAAAMRAYRAFPGAVAGALALSLAATLLGLLSMLVLARVVGATGSAEMMLVLLPIGVLVNTIPLTPGGLGVGEVAMDRLFSLAGLTGGAATLITWRLFLLIPAALGLVLYIQGRADFVAPARPPDSSAVAA
ncbi:MAG: lysylphosphatidylglycerol synthase transmembrane domain-containing protein [Gemmatimonadota bacterium]|nr:lysylphosphatidylglycerol synthase transmembrane domain-containing protein [Gemmatimonadota bacterium]